MAGVAITAFVVLTSTVGGHTLPTRPDYAIELMVVGGIPRDSVAVQTMVALGEPLPAAALTAVLVGLCLWFNSRRAAIVAALAPIVTVAAVSVLKPTVGRLHAGSLSFPSGHAAFITAFVIAAGLLVVEVRGSRTRDLIVVVALAGLVCGAIGVSLVANRMHYASDSVAAFFLATTITLSLNACVRAVGRT